MRNRPCAGEVPSARSRADPVAFRRSPSPRPVPLSLRPTATPFDDGASGPLSTGPPEPSPNTLLPDPGTGPALPLPLPLPPELPTPPEPAAADVPFPPAETSELAAVPTVRPARAATAVSPCRARPAEPNRPVPTPCACVRSSLRLPLDLSPRALSPRDLSPRDLSALAALARPPSVRSPLARPPLARSPAVGSTLASPAS